jgi:Uncharacterized protein conserved in bacteria (DUF2252)
MKFQAGTRNYRYLVLSSLAIIFGYVPIAFAQSCHYDDLANAPFAENRPTPETAKLLRDELLFQRATQTYLWALPRINTLGMKIGSEKTFGAGYSVGTRCYISLNLADDDDPLFLQIKEARRSVLESPRGKSRFAHQGFRVVEGQRLMQAGSDIFLGWCGTPHHEYYVRQFRDMKVSADAENFKPSTTSPLSVLRSLVSEHHSSRYRMRSGSTIQS